MPLIVMKGLGRSLAQKILGVNNLINLHQVAGITSAYGKPRERPYKTFDYRKKLFTHLHQPFDRTHKRWDENSRVVVIDGPIASGKHEFAKKLAKELDFLYVPQNLDIVAGIYDFDGFGFKYGMRRNSLEELLEPQYRIYDVDAFLTDKAPRPKDGGGRVGQLQWDLFAMRLFTYNDALLHMLSIGQGVVCVRSPWTDQVFGRALYENGYLTRAGYQFYKDELIKNHLVDFPRPHLTIYLDASVDETLANIKERNRDHEASSQVLTGDFLAAMEEEYKDTVLPSLTDHSELLVYPSIPNITEHEVQLMVEDIEDLGPMAHTGISDDIVFADWAITTDEELAAQRRSYQNFEKARSVKQHILPYNCPEFVQTWNWDHARRAVYTHTVKDWQDKMDYHNKDPGYNPYDGASVLNVVLGRNSYEVPTERRYFFVPAA